MPAPQRYPGPSNFRDLGVYTGEGGRPLRRGRIFRSDHLGALDGEALAALGGLGLDRVLDLRGAAERQSAACALPGVAVHSLAIEPTIVQVLNDLLAAGHRITPHDVVAHMQDTYRGFVRNNTHRFAELFAHLLQARGPLVFHCTAGKDRTGFAAALILHALGVREDDIVHDYLLTNERLRPPEASKWGLEPEVARVLWRVQPEFLQAAFEAVDRDHGGVQAYLREGLGLGPEQRRELQARYLA